MVEVTERKCRYLTSHGVVPVCRWPCSMLVALQNTDKNEYLALKSSLLLVVCGYGSPAPLFTLSHAAKRIFKGKKKVEELGLILLTRGKGVRGGLYIAGNSP